MWHWLDSEAPDGNRTQYLDEAAGLAASGAVCLLPQGRFPWSQPPTGSGADTIEVLAEAARLRAGLDLLAGTCRTWIPPDWASWGTTSAG